MRQKLFHLRLDLVLQLQNLKGLSHSMFAINLIMPSEDYVWHSWFLILNFEYSNIYIFFQITKRNRRNIEIFHKMSYKTHLAVYQLNIILYILVQNSSRRVLSLDLLVKLFVFDIVCLIDQNPTQPQVLADMGRLLYSFSMSVFFNLTELVSESLIVELF